MKTTINSHKIESLINRVASIPGVTYNHAHKAIHCMLHDDTGICSLNDIARLIMQVTNNVRTCKNCNAVYAETECQVCATRGEGSVLCIVDTILDVSAIKRAQAFQGRYFITYMSIFYEKNSRQGLCKILSAVKSNKIKDIVIALPMSIEGIHFSNVISKMLKSYVNTVTSIRCGIPLGDKVHTSSLSTIKYAFKNRVEILH